MPEKAPIEHAVSFLEQTLRRGRKTLASQSGYNFVVVDMEHGHGGVSDALSFLHALAATQKPSDLSTIGPKIEFFEFCKH